LYFEENKRIRLQQQPASSSFKATSFQEKTLLLDEIFPTVIVATEENNRKIYLAGTYGAGLFISTRPPYWEFLGLDNLVITKIVLDQNYPSFSHDRKITFRIRSMLAKQVEHD
jgi:hypothetical protein